MAKLTLLLALLFTSVCFARAPKFGIFPDDITQVVLGKSTSYYSLVILSQIGQSLLEQDSAGEIKPGIAETWSISQDLKTFTFKIRKGVRFHDGSELTIEDVIWSLNEAVYSESGVAAFHLKMLKGYEAGRSKRSCAGIRKSDANTLVIELVRPYKPLLKLLSTAATVILKKQAGSDRAAIGSGPYRLVLDAAANRATLEAFSAYRGSFAPQIKVIELIRNSSIIRGEAKLSPADLPDFDTMVPVDRVAVYKADSFTIAERPTLNSSGFILNPSGPWKNRGSRDLLIGYLQMAADAASGVGGDERLNDLYPRGMIGHVENRASLTEQRARGREAVKREGKLKINRKIRIAVAGTLIADRKKFAEEFKRASGVEVEYLNLTFGDLTKQARKKDYDALYLNWKSIILDPDANLPIFDIAGTFQILAAGSEFLKLKSDATSENLDGRRAQLFGELADKIFSASVYVPLFQVKERFAIRKGLQISSHSFRYSPMFSDIQGSPE